MGQHGRFELRNLASPSQIHETLHRMVKVCYVLLAQQPAAEDLVNLPLVQSLQTGAATHLALRMSLGTMDHTWYWLASMRENWLCCLLSYRLAKPVQHSAPRLVKVKTFLVAMSASMSLLGFSLLHKLCYVVRCLSATSDATCVSCMNTVNYNPGTSLNCVNCTTTCPTGKPEGNTLQKRENRANTSE